MHQSIKYLLECLLSHVRLLLEQLLGAIEWYTHSIDIKAWHNPYKYSNSRVLWLDDDDEEIVEDFDVYFHEYDWETEKGDK